MLRCFIYLISALLLLRAAPWVASAEAIAIEELSYTDPHYLALYESTIASKNRLLKHERKPQYDPPKLYRYMMKKGEDIWTLVAKTSLPIDAIATLNRADFIGMIGEEKEVFLTDTLGIFFETNAIDKIEILNRFSATFAMREEDILTIEDPLNTSGSLYFAPEVQLSFLERTYMMGVVFYAPLMGIETSKYGTRVDPFVNEMTFHGGVDIAAVEGKRVHAARWGNVLYADKSDGYGNLVVLKHELGYHTFYGHLGELQVAAGDDVESGQVIGAVGSTGRTTGPHLHFEIRRYNQTLNPDNIPFFLEHK